MNLRQYDYINESVSKHKFECRYIPESYIRNSFFLEVLDQAIIRVVKEKIRVKSNPLELEASLSPVYTVEAVDGSKLYFFWLLFGDKNFMFSDESDDKVKIDHSWFIGLFEELRFIRGAPIIHRGGDLMVPKVEKNED